MTDRTTNLMLILIAAALWGLLLRPAFAPAPARAAEAEPFITNPNPRFANPVVKFSPNNGHLYVVDNGGFVYLVDPITLDMKRSVRLVPKP